MSFPKHTVVKFVGNTPQKKQSQAEMTPLKRAMARHHFTPTSETKTKPSSSGQGDGGKQSKLQAAIQKQFPSQQQPPTQSHSPTKQLPTNKLSVVMFTPTKSGGNKTINGSTMKKSTHKIQQRLHNQGAGQNGHQNQNQNRHSRNRNDDDDHFSLDQNPTTIISNPVWRTAIDQEVDQLLNGSSDSLDLLYQEALQMSKGPEKRQNGQNGPNSLKNGQNGTKTGQNGQGLSRNIPESQHPQRSDRNRDYNGYGGKGGKGGDVGGRGRDSGRGGGDRYGTDLGLDSSDDDLLSLGGTSNGYNSSHNDRNGRYGRGGDDFGYDDDDDDDDDDIAHGLFGQPSRDDIAHGLFDYGSSNGGSRGRDNNGGHGLTPLRKGQLSSSTPLRKGQSSTKGQSSIFDSSTPLHKKGQGKPHSSSSYDPFGAALNSYQPPTTMNDDDNDDDYIDSILDQLDDDNDDYANLGQLPPKKNQNGQNSSKMGQNGPSSSKMSQNNTTMNDQSTAAFTFEGYKPYQHNTMRFDKDLLQPQGKGNQNKLGAKNGQDGQNAFKNGQNSTQNAPSQMDTGPFSIENTLKNNPKKNLRKSMAFGALGGNIGQNNDTNPNPKPHPPSTPTPPPPPPKPKPPPPPQSPLHLTHHLLPSQSQTHRPTSTPPTQF